MQSDSKKTYNMLQKRKVVGGSFRGLVDQLWTKEALFVFHKTHQAGAWKEITSYADYQKLVLEIDGSVLGGFWAVPEMPASFFTEGDGPPPPFQIVDPARSVPVLGKNWSVISRPTEDYVLACIMKNVPVLDYFK